MNQKTQSKPRYLGPEVFNAADSSCGNWQVTVEGAKDVEKRELDARVVAKQKLVADRHAAVAAAEEAEKRAAEPQGLDAFGPRPLVEYGKGSAYHSAVLDDCHRDEARRNRCARVVERPLPQPFQLECLRGPFQLECLRSRSNWSACVAVPIAPHTHATTRGLW